MERVRRQVEDIYEDRTDGGKGVVAVLLDTGAAPHPDLEGRVLCFRDFVKEESAEQRAFALPGEASYDDNGHGTHVAGILCGSGALSGGKYRGLAPGVRLAVGKVLDGQGDGSADAMLKGLDWALALRDRYPVRILNISVGIGALDDKEKERALQEKLERIWESGILAVCAAGNKGPREGSLSSVGGFSQVVTVGCHDGAYFADLPGQCRNYSGRGFLGAAFRKPDLVAPGTEIFSCCFLCRRRAEGYESPYMAKSGTSMATAIVSAAAALAFEKYPGLSNKACGARLKYTAQDLGEPWNLQGWGMVNVRRLLGESP